MARQVSKRGISNVKNAWIDATDEAEEKEFDPELIKDANLPRFGIMPGEWDGAPIKNMPPGCPVQVLGYDGKIVYCRTAMGQLMAIEKFANGEIEALFAPYIAYAMWAWPGFGKIVNGEDGKPLPPKVKRLERDKARDAILNESRSKSMFSPRDAVRGRGGWKDKGKRFVWNSGSGLYTSDRGRLLKIDQAQYDGYFYEMKPDVMKPWKTPVDLEMSPAPRLLESLRSWSFESPLDALFVLGWMACGLMGGALDWRPVVFTTGGKGVGKSTMQGLIKHVLGKTLLDTTDTTPAGIYQHVQNDCLPVMIDEMENKAGSSRAQSIMELARLAPSGGHMNRGGANHEGKTFEIRNCFFMSAVNPPPMESTDRSRMPILNLSRLETSRRAGSLVVNEHDGRMILRQIMDGWDEFYTRILPDWKTGLADAGMDDRAQATYGTLLAAAQLLVGPMVMEDMGLDTTEMRRAGAVIAGLTAGERSEQTDNWQQCIDHLLASPIEAWRSGERITPGSVMQEYREKPETFLDDAKYRLGAASLTLEPRSETFEWGALAIPFKKLPPLLKLFQDTNWHGGVWSTALRQAPKDIVVRGYEKGFRISGSAPMKCLLIDMKKFDDWARSEGM